MSYFRSSVYPSSCHLNLIATTENSYMNMNSCRDNSSNEQSDDSLTKKATKRRYFHDANLQKEANESKKFSEGIELVQSKKAAHEIIKNETVIELQNPNLNEKAHKSKSRTIPIKSENTESTWKEQSYLNPKTVIFKDNTEDCKKPVDITLQSLKTEDLITPKLINSFTKILNEKKSYKRAVKTPLFVRRKKLNAKLSKLLIPKNAVVLLNEIKPGCIYKVEEKFCGKRPNFWSQVEYKNEILGIGLGATKIESKTAAAENAIKTIVSISLTQNGAEINNTTERKIKSKKTVGSVENIPWAGLASFALFKLFREWQSQGTDIPLERLSTHPKNKDSIKIQTVKKLPPNVKELHPTAVLNEMKPGVTAMELGRQTLPVSYVTMGYLIDGQMYEGSAPNKKDAKKEAAKAVISALWGVKYE